MQLKELIQNLTNIFLIKRNINSLNERQRQDLSNAVLREKQILPPSHYSIRSNTSKVYDEIEEEYNFIQELLNQASNFNLRNRFDFLRQSDGGISISYAGYPIGRIKLRGRKTYMQILQSLYKHESFYDLTYMEYVEHISSWLKYIQNYVRRR